ncbi:hypothetical protein HK096_004487, partial [Nowakowskiella sp. JEL0078]
MLFVFKRRKLLVVCSAAVAVLCLCAFSAGSWFKLFHLISYNTRPLWDSELKASLGRWKAVDNLGFVSPEISCSLHSFALRAQPAPRVFDVFLFSQELDLLEVRLHELSDVVDVFVLIEADCTFMGQHKQLVFDLNRNDSRFNGFGDRIHHAALRGFCGEDKREWAAENAIRSRAIEEARKAGALDGDLFMFSDADEIPRGDSVRLLKSCDFGSRINLALDSFRYSFDFRVWPDFVFRSTVSVIGRVPDYEISARFRVLTDVILADAGWHCSWCFRNIADFSMKMEGYSHSDRLHSPHLLLPEVIQEKLCSGQDIFEYSPEAHTFHSLISQSVILRSKGVSLTPKYVVQNPHKFRYLLPG